jgi:serine/threonine protein phosphatase PrpC
MTAQKMKKQNIEDFKRRIQSRDEKEFDIDIGMSGSTCTLVIIVDKVLYYGFVGDSLMVISKIMTPLLE